MSSLLDVMRLRDMYSSCTYTVRATQKWRVMYMCDVSDAQQSPLSVSSLTASEISVRIHILHFLFHYHWLAPD